MFLMMFVGFFFVAASDVSAQNCKPGPNQIAIFADWKYQGDCRIIDFGQLKKKEGFPVDTRDLNNVEEVGFANDSMSSVLLGRNVGVQLCVDINLEGTCRSFDKSIPDLSKTDVGNDSVSSLGIYRIR